MKALFLILLAIALLFYIKITLHASYDTTGVKAEISVFGLKKPLLPQKYKPKAKKKQNFWDIYCTANAALMAFNEVKHGIVIEHIDISYICADNDPYTAVMKFNAVNAFAYSLLTYLESCFKVKNREINIDTDMTADKSVTELSAQLSLRVGQIVYFIIIFVFETIKLKRRLGNGKQTQRNDAVGNEQREAAC